MLCCALVLSLPIGLANDSTAAGPWVEITGFVDEVNGDVVVVQGVWVDISRAEVDIWQPLEAGFLVEVEGWLDTSVTPMLLIASEFELEGIGYDYERDDNHDDNSHDDDNYENDENGNDDDHDDAEDDDDDD